MDEREAVYRKRTRPLKRGLAVHESLTSERLEVVKLLKDLHSPKESSPLLTHYTNKGKIYIKPKGSTRTLEVKVGATREDILALCGKSGGSSQPRGPGGDNPSGVDLNHETLPKVAHADPPLAATSSTSQSVAHVHNDSAAAVPCSPRETQPRMVESSELAAGSTCEGGSTSSAERESTRTVPPGPRPGAAAPPGGDGTTGGDSLGRYSSDILPVISNTFATDIKSPSESCTDCHSHPSRRSLSLPSTDSVADQSTGTVSVQTPGGTFRAKPCIVLDEPRSTSGLATGKSRSGRPLKPPPPRTP